MAKKRLPLIEQVEQDNSAQQSSFNTEGVKSFIRDASEKVGERYNDEKVDKVIKHYNYDYDRMINEAGQKAGIKDINKFRESVYKKYGFSKPTDTEAAEMRFIKTPIVTDPTPETGYQRHKELQDELTLTNAFIENIKASQSKATIPTRDILERDISPETIPQKEDPTEYLEPTDPRVVELLNKQKAIKQAIKEQEDLNVKSIGFAHEEHEALSKEQEEIEGMLNKAISEREEKAIKTPAIAMAKTGGEPIYRREEQVKVQDLQGILDIYKDLNKLYGAPKGEGFDKQAKALFYGLGNNFFTQDFVTLGLNEMGRLLNVKGAFETKQKLLKEGKTEEEIAEIMPSEEVKLLDTYQMMLEIQAGADPNSLYYWGEGLKDMIPFIAQFAATSGYGAGAKEVVKAYVQKQTKSAVAGRIAGAIAKPMTQAALMVPANLQGYAERVAPTMDEKGNLVEGMNPLKAAVLTYANTVAEVVGEDVGSYVNKSANKVARESYRKMIGGNPSAAQQYLGKMALALTRDTNIPTIQGVAFEGLGEEVTGLLQAVINQDDSFFTSEAQAQIWGMSLIASGSFMSTSVPGRLKAKNDFNRAKGFLDDIPNGEYAQAVDQLSQNYDNVEDVFAGLGELNTQFGDAISQEDKAKARNYVSNAVVYNQMNTSRAIQVEEQMAESVGKDGNVTLAQYEGQYYSVRNPESLGEEGQVVFLKDQEGNVKPVISSKITDWDGKTQEEIINTTLAAQDEQDATIEAEQQATEQALATATEKDLVEGKTVITPDGKKTLVSVNPDGTSTVVNNKGEEAIVNTDEIEPYKTQEQKDTEQAEAEANLELMEGIEEGAEVVQDESLYDGSDVRVIDYSNGQSKIITPEGAQIVNTPEERDAIIQELASAEIEATQETIDDLPPEQAFAQMRETDPDVANELLADDIESIKAQAEVLRGQVKETESRQEKANLLKQAKELEAQAVSLEEILADPTLIDAPVEEVPPEVAPEVVAEEPVQVERTPDIIHAEYQQEKDLAPANQLLPWQTDLLARKINRESFNKFGDRNLITQGLARAWFSPKDQVTTANNIDAIAEELSEQGLEVAPDDIVNFIVDNPTASVRTTTDRMNELQREYKEVAGKPITQHVEPKVITQEDAGTPFRAAPPKTVLLSDKAQEDLVNKTRVEPTLNQLQQQFGIPITVINSSEMPEHVKRAAKGKDITAAGFYDPTTGTAYFISDNIKRIADVKKTYLHEAVLHKGLDLLFDAGPVKLLGRTYETKAELLDDAYSRMSEETISDRMKDYAKGLTVDQLTDTQKRELAEEALATLSETESPRLQVMFDKLYNFIKKLFGFTGKQFTKRDLRNLLREHRDLVKQQTGVEAPKVESAKEPVKFRTEDGQSFNEWKGNNELVEDYQISDVKTGQPIVAKAYHGTTHSFYEFKGGEIGNVKGHLGKTNYFTSEYGDAQMNYGEEGADLTGRIEQRKEQLEYDVEQYAEDDTFNYKGISEEFDIPIEDIQDLDTIDDISKAIAEKELKGEEEQVLELYVKLNNPLVLGSGPVHIETIDEAELSDYMDDAAEEIADENGIELEEAKEDYSGEIRERAIENSGAEDRVVEAMRLALEGNEVYNKTLYDFLPEYFGEEVDLNQIDKDLRASEELMYIEDPETGELANHQIISDFYEELGYDGVILTDVNERFPNMDMGSNVSHIHVPDQYNNQIKLADGSNTTFGETSDIRFRVADTFYSPTEKALESIKQDKGTVAQFEQMLLKNGAKQAELDWMGFREQFPSVNSKVSKQDIQEWIDNNKIEIREVEKGIEGVGQHKTVEEISDAKDILLQGGKLYAIDSSGQAIKIVEDSNEIAPYIIDNWDNYTVKEGDIESLDRESPTKYADYQLPGGKNYKEMLLTMPEKKPEIVIFVDKLKAKYGVQSPIQLEKVVTAEENKKWNELTGKGDYSKLKENYKSSHFEEPNILAHVRFNERFDNDGNKVLFLEEIQSDWAQEGRKKGVTTKWKPEQLKVLSKEEAAEYSIGEGVWGVEATNEEGQQEQVFSILKRGRPTEQDVINYIVEQKPRTEGVPDMPFKKTDQWLNLGLRRMIRYAAENGFDKIAWTTGEQQAERYDLSKQIDQIGYYKVEDGLWDVNALKGDQLILGEHMDADKIEATFGKEIADKIINNKGEDRDGVNYLKGDNLKVGGEGMKSFYNQMVPKAANKLGKKFGAKVAPMDMYYGEDFKQLALPITDKMKESALEEGMPMFRVEDVSDQISKLEAQRKGLVSEKNRIIKQANERQGLFGDTMADPNDLFGGQGFDPQEALRKEKEINQQIEKIDGEITLLKKQLDTGKTEADGQRTMFRVAESQQELDNFVKDSKIKTTVYHGTNRDFTEFKKESIGSANDQGFYGKGFYFTFNSDPKWQPMAKGEAEYYGSNVIEAKLNVKNPFDIGKLSQYKGHDIRVMGDESIVFLSNIAEQFPDIAKNITIRKKGKYNPEDESWELLQIPITELPALIKKYTDDLVFENVNDDMYNRKYVNAHLKSKVETRTYTGSDGKTHSWEDAESLASGNGFIVEDNGKKFEYPKEEMEISFVIDALEKYEGITADYHPEGYMTRNPEITEAIKAKGHDAIVQSMEGDEIVVFEPDQILIEPKEDVKFRVEEEREKVETNPSEKQVEAGNYQKGHVKFDGFDISIENPRGSIRKGQNEKGETWSNIMPADYGYFKGTIGKDKDHIDVFLGDNLESDKVYVVDQINPETGAFDEHKVLMGYNSLSEARTSKDGLKEWFKGDTKKPFAPIQPKFSVDENLSWVLEKSDKSEAYTGKEKSKKLPNNIEKLTADTGSVRYIKYDDKGNPLSGLQIVTRGELASIANAYTNPDQRRKGYAKELALKAKSDYPTLKHSEILEEDGKKFAEAVKFQVKSDDPKVQAMLDKLARVQELSKTAARIKGMEQEKLQSLGPARKFMEDKIELYKEAVSEGKAEATEMIKEVQKTITDYAKKALPLTEAGAREIGPILTLIKNAQTPEDVEAAINRIDELAGTTTEKQERRKYVSKVNRLLKWMTGLKKSGTKRVGKFNYEDTMAFQELKKIDKQINELTRITRSNKATTEEKAEAESKLSQEWETLNAKENKTSLDEAVLKLIELRRLGSKASPALAKAVAEELEAIYSEAKEAKSEADIDKAISRREDKEFVKEFVRDQPLEDKPLIKRAITKLNNFTANTMGNWETLMTILGGTKARDKFSLILNQVDEEMGIQASFNKVLDKAQEDYGLKNRNQVLKHIQKLKEEKYELRKPNRAGEVGEGKPMKLSTMNLIDINNAVKNEDIANSYYMSYGDITLAEDGSRDTEAQRRSGKQRIDALLDNLTPADKAFGDSMMEVVNTYKESTNEVFVKMFNRDMDFVENYWPSTAEFESDVDVMDKYFTEGKMPSATQQRSTGRTPRPVDAFDKFNKHVKESEWYKNMSLPLNEINKVFKDQNVQDLITEARGEGFLKTIQTHFKNLGLGASTRDLTSLERWGGKILGNWVSAKIGLTPSVPFKQLTSMINYAENMPVGTWGTGFVKGLATPRKTFDWMWENVPYLQDRFKGGYSEALQYAMNAASGMPKATNTQQAIKNVATIGTRGGDIAAIVYGGKPYIDYLMKKKGMSKEEAVNKFMLDTLRSQQAPFSSTLSTYQNSKNPFAKALFTFANTPSQYMRKMFEASQAYRHGDISAAQLSKIYAIYGVANQFLYVGAGALISALMKGSDPEEKLGTNTVVQSLTSLVAGIPLVRDIVNTTLKRTTGLHVYDDALPVIGELDQIGEAVIKAIQGKDAEKNIEKAFILLMELGGIPAGNAKKLWDSTVNRDVVVSKTVKYEVRDKLNELSKSENNFEARMAADIKKSYSKAKGKATRLRNEGKTLQADRIDQLIEDSKMRLRDDNYNKLGVELRRFDVMLDAID
jgi:hypothetical protein